MTWIKPPQHDTIARELRQRGTTKPSVSRPSPIDNTSTNNDTSHDRFRRGSIPIQQQTQKRRLHDRRKNNRRSQHISVLLDTRVNRDRRQSQRHSHKKGLQQKIKGFDDYC